MGAQAKTYRQIINGQVHNEVADPPARQLMITDDTDTVVVLDEEPPPVHRALGSRRRMDEIDGTPGGHLPPVEVLKPPHRPLPSASQGPPRASREAPALRNDAY